MVPTHSGGMVFRSRPPLAFYSHIPSPTPFTSELTNPLGGCLSGCHPLVLATLLVGHPAERKPGATTYRGTQVTEPICPTPFLRTGRKDTVRWPSPADVKETGAQQAHSNLI